MKFGSSHERHQDILRNRLLQKATRILLGLPDLATSLSGKGTTAKGALARATVQQLLLAF